MFEPTKEQLEKLAKVAEFWVPSDESPDYIVSDLGRVASYKNNGWGTKKNFKILTPHVPKDGYPEVYFYLNGVKHNKRVHILVLETFEGPCPKGMQGCHNNGMKIDTRFLNLRWDTPKNNQADRLKHDTDSRGSKSVNSKLIESDIPMIRDLIKRKIGYREIGRWFGVSSSTICRINKKEGWSHV